MQELRLTTMALNMTDAHPPAAVTKICICLWAFKHESYLTRGYI